MFDRINKTVRVRVSGFLVREGTLLLIAHRKKNDIYWLLPGGGIEFGESLKAALAREFPRELRIEWRDLPLSFHAQARVAAEAAQEAFAQRGDVGFWAMHDLLFAHQGDPGGLEVPALRGYAARIGLDVARFDAALERRVHAPAIDADVAAAAQAGITGTPGAVVNGYFVSGARELRVFRRAVRRALEDHRRGQRP